jgi:hypothetical protein
MRIRQEEFEDIKGIIRIRKSKNDSHHNRQEKKDKMTNNVLQNIYIKLKIEQHQPGKTNTTKNRGGG